MRRHIVLINTRNSASTGPHVIGAESHHLHSSREDSPGGASSEDYLQYNRIVRLVLRAGPAKVSALAE